MTLKRQSATVISKVHPGKERKKEEKGEEEKV